MSAIAMSVTSVIGLYTKMKACDQRLNKRVILVSLIAVSLSLFALPVYHVSIVKAPVINPQIYKWIPEGVGVEYPVTFLPFAIGYVSDAIEIVREEQKESRAERDAFDRFINEINAIPAVEQSQSLRVQPSGNMVSTSKSTQLQEIRRAYEETVMATPHYEEEYNDTMTESLAEEFGPEIATQLVAGETYTPLIKEQLIKAAQQSRLEREQLLPTLESEQEALQTARTTLETIDTQLERITARPSSRHSSDELIQNYNRLTEAEETCETVLEERQQQRVTGHATTPPRAEIADLHSYLYHSLPVTYPVLADTTKLLERLRHTQRQLTKEFEAQS
jgi:hypothetical protein